MSKVKQFLAGNTLALVGSVFGALLIGVMVYSAFVKPQFNTPAYTSSLTQSQALALATSTAELSGGTVYSVKDTGSMRPLIDSNCYLLVVDDYENTPVDSMVLFWRDETLVVHLVFDKNERRMRTAATSGQGWDRTEITHAEYVGTVIGHFYFNK